MFTSVVLWRDDPGSMLPGIAYVESTINNQVQLGFTHVVRYNHRHMAGFYMMFHNSGERVVHVMLEFFSVSPERSSERVHLSTCKPAVFAWPPARKSFIADDVSLWTYVI